MQAAHNPATRPLSLAVVMVTPLAILLTGLGTAGWYAWSHIGDLTEENGRGATPPAFQIMVKEPGRHTLRLHTQTIHEGTAYSTPSLPAGARVLIEGPDGKDVPLASDMLSGKKSMGSERAISIATFEANATGPYSVHMKGSSEVVVLSVAPGKVGKVMGYVITVIAICLTSFVMALIALIVLLHRRAKALKIQQIPWGGSPNAASRPDPQDSW